MAIKPWNGKPLSLKVIGTNAGTSMDGLDCCLCEISLSQNFNYHILDFNTYKYSKDLIKKISDNVGKDNINSIKSLDDYLGKIFRDIVKDFLKNKTVDLISTHGQTIIHQSGKRSIQIGNPKFMYDIFKIPIIHNFRQKDISLGGTGAPLVPYLDWLLFQFPTLKITNPINFIHSCRLYTFFRFTMKPQQALHV